MLRTGYEPATPATKRPQTYALECAATGIGVQLIHPDLIPSTIVYGKVCKF
jgi:hypothetical protein